MEGSKRSEATVFVVDDDEAVRDSLSMLVRSVGLEAETFASAAEFLDAFDAERRGCLVLDVRMPGMGGLDLQERLVEMNAALPIIFITGHGEIPLAVRAIQAGAVDFLQKPFSDQELLDRIHQALEDDLENRRQRAGQDEIRARLGTLTPREREVLDLVVEGEANKVIANRLGVSQRTVEVHRARVMEKMQADSLAHLVRLVLRSRE